MVTSTESSNMGWTRYGGNAMKYIEHKLEGLEYKDALCFVDDLICDGFSVQMKYDTKAKRCTVVAEKLIEDEEEEINDC